MNIQIFISPLFQGSDVHGYFFSDAAKGKNTRFMYYIYAEAIKQCISCFFPSSVLKGARKPCIQSKVIGRFEMKNNDTLLSVLLS